MSRLAPAPPGMASAIAFISAEIAAVVPASPAPLTPSGLVFAGTGSDVEQRNAGVGADHAVVAVAVLVVGLVGFEHVGGDLLAFGEQRVDGFEHGVADGHRRTRADRGVARDLHGGIAVPML